MSTEDEKKNDEQQGWLVTAPNDGKGFAQHMQAVCRGNEKAGKVLGQVLFLAKLAKKQQNLPESCNAVTFTIKLDDLIKSLREVVKCNVSKKSLIHYFDLFNEWKYVGSERYGRQFTVYGDAIQEAVNHHPPLPKRKQYDRRKKKSCNVEDKKEVQLSDDRDKQIRLLNEKVEELQLKDEIVQQIVVSLQLKVEELQRYIFESPRSEKPLQDGIQEGALLNNDTKGISNTDREDSFVVADASDTTQEKPAEEHSLEETSKRVPIAEGIQENGAHSHSPMATGNTGCLMNEQTPPLRVESEEEQPTNTTEEYDGSNENITQCAAPVLGKVNKQAESEASNELSGTSGDVPPDSNETAPPQPVKPARNTSKGRSKKNEERGGSHAASSLVLLPGGKSSSRERRSSKSTIALADLSELELRFWTFWCNIDQHNKAKPKTISAVAYGYIGDLAPHITTQEQMNSLTKFTREKVRAQVGDPKLWKLHLGNIHSWFSAWEQSQQPQQNVSGRRNFTRERIEQERREKEARENGTLPPHEEALAQPEEVAPASPSEKPMMFMTRHERRVATIRRMKAEKEDERELVAQ